jgi:uncharacterized protein YndB with AHSA1/START domain
MTQATPYTPDPKLDLVLERVVDVPRALAWEAWTKPEHLKKWFTPAPWTIAACEVDLRPGGLFRVDMRSPDGRESSDIRGCYLDVVPQERLVWTDALTAGYRPAVKPFITAIVTFATEGNGTRYKAVVLHGSEDDRKRHEEMGFFDGWGTVLDQMVALIKTGL